MTLRGLHKRLQHVDRVALARWQPRVASKALMWQVLTEPEQIALKHILRRIKAVTIQGLTDLELECIACLRERMDGISSEPCELREMTDA